MRNPPTSRHTPRAEGGATILVKLRQFDPDDRTQIAIDTNAQTPEPAQDRPGVGIIPLFRDARENVRLEVWAPGQDVTVAGHEGLEILVLEGGFTEGAESFVPNSWLRLPIGHDFVGIAGPEGARLWVKSDHLRHAPGVPA